MVTITGIRENRVHIERHDRARLYKTARQVAKARGLTLEEYIGHCGLSYKSWYDNLSKAVRGSCYLKSIQAYFTIFGVKIEGRDFVEVPVSPLPLESRSKMFWSCDGKVGLPGPEQQVGASIYPAPAERAMLDVFKKLDMNSKHQVFIYAQKLFFESLTK